MPTKPRMNALMARSWAALADAGAPPALHDALARLAASPLVDFDGALVLEPLISPGLGRPTPGDLTGFEALTNHIHLIDHVDEDCTGLAMLAQGVAYAEALAHRLSSRGGRFQVTLSHGLEDDQVIVRFHTLRSSEPPYLSEDLEGYELHEVACWEV